MKTYKTFKSYIFEQENLNDPDRVYRVDPVGRTEVFQKNRYAILGENGEAGTAPVEQNVKPGDTLYGQKVHEIRKTTFASPGKPNSFYGAFGRTAGPGGTPVKGAAVFDENKMWGSNRNPNYKGTIHTTQENLDNMPEYISIHSAASKGFKTEPFSGKEECTSSDDVQDVQSHGKVKTIDLLKQQYHIKIHPDVESINDHLNKVKKEQPNMSVLDQT